VVATRNRKITGFLKDPLINQRYVMLASTRTLPTAPGVAITISTVPSRWHFSLGSLLQADMLSSSSNAIDPALRRTDACALGH